MRIVCLSDTHNHHDFITVPDGDLLIHAGDLTGRGTMPEVLAVNKWLGTLPHRHKIIIAGNHDFGFEREPALFRSLITNAIYLQHEAVEVAGLKIFGSPYTPWFHNWAFNVQSPADMARHWSRIPDDTDILITHGPPEGVLDDVVHRPCGCRPLKAAWRVCDLAYTSSATSMKAPAGCCWNGSRGRKRCASTPRN